MTPIPVIWRHCLARMTLSIVFTFISHATVLFFFPSPLTADDHLRHAAHDTPGAASRHHSGDASRNNAGDASRPAAILFVGYLNPDCHPDTVLGLPDAQMQYLPTEIRWGSAPNADSACGGRTPKHLRLRSTTFHYPAWRRMTGTVAFQRLNADTLTDMVFHFRGEDDKANGNGSGASGNGNRAVPRDTARTVAVFGQSGLDSIRVLNIAAVGRFQTSPAIMMQLEPGVDLVRPGRRDLSGRTSFELRPVALDVENPGRPEEAPEAVAAPVVTLGAAAPDAPHRTGTPAVVMYVYPNPSSATASVDARPLPPGDYAVEVLGLNGETVLRQDVRVPASGALLRRLDVARLASGYYVLRIHQHGEIIAADPIIIAR